MEPLVWLSLEDHLFLPVMALLGSAQDVILSSNPDEQPFFQWGLSRSEMKPYPAPDLRWPIPNTVAPTAYDCIESGSRSLQAVLTSLIRLSYPGDHIVNTDSKLSEMTVERAIGSCVEASFCAKKIGVASCVLSEIPLH